MSTDGAGYRTFQFIFYILLLVALGLHPVRDFVEHNVTFLFH